MLGVRVELLKLIVCFMHSYIILLYIVSTQVQEPSEEPFDIDSVPNEVKSQPLAEKKAPGKKPTGMLSSIPEFSKLWEAFQVFTTPGAYRGRSRIWSQCC
ncbi:coatomer subunit gamma-1-like [Rhododendron vialii]|uniref:coatomer subunit gamma-1-like n=1 Tax=Rhododendron vialii TaxID=182163 RepID=UPI00265FE92C|nr:coatomer subunit gamma-1-like [Rhododendron vialii]